MEFVIAGTVGCLFACGVYMMLRKSLVKLVFGLVLSSHAVNLLVFSSGGLTRGRPPIVPEGETALAVPYADPLPQALVLTAIVISFGVLAFAAVLIHRVVQGSGSSDSDEIRNSDA